MNLDQKLRETADELNRAVSGRRPTHRFHRRNHRGPVLALTTAASILIPVVVISSMVFNGSEPGLSAPAGSTADQPQEATPTTQPDSTTVPISSDGLSEADQLPQGWDSGLGADAVLVLAEDGVALAVSIGDTGGFTTWATGGQRQGTVVDVAGEIPDTAVWVETVSGQASAAVFGLVEPETTHVEIQVDGVTYLTTDRVFKRPGIGRAVFIGSLDTSNLPQAWNIWQITTTSPEATTSVVTLDTPETAADPEEVTLSMLLARGPLVVGRSDVDSLPGAVACQTPDNIETPPNKGESLPPANTYPTPDDALDAFIADTAIEHQLATSGYLELHTSDGLIGYGTEFEGGPGFVTIVAIDQTEQGWAVTGWEASGC